GWVDAARARAGRAPLLDVRDIDGRPGREAAEGYRKGGARRRDVAGAVLGGIQRDRRRAADRRFGVGDRRHFIGRRQGGAEDRTGGRRRRGRRIVAAAHGQQAERDCEG